MQWHDRDRMISNRLFYLHRAYAHGLRVNIDKNRSVLHPEYGVGRCGEGVRRGDDLAVETQRLLGGYERGGGVTKQGYMWKLEELT